MNDTNDKKQFINSPICVTDENDIVCQFIELDLKPFHNFNILEIYSAEKKVHLGTYEFFGIEERHAIFVPKKWLKIEVRYRQQMKDDYGNKVTEDVLITEKNLFELSGSMGVRDIDLERFDRILNKVRDAMDNPEGTTTEVKAHTQLLKNSIFDENARTYVTEKMRNIIAEFKEISYVDIDYYVYKIYSMVYGLGVVQELDDDPEVGEILVNAVTFPKFKSTVYYIKNQVKYKSDVQFANLEELKRVFGKSIEFSGKQLNESANAIVEATRPNRDRVTIIQPLASDNYSLNIRKFSNFVPDADSMRKSGTVDEVVEKIYSVLVNGKANIGIGGPMGTGKTTMINYMLTYTTKDSRKVVIASVSETDVDRVLKGHDTLIFNVNEEKGFTFDSLVRVSLRTTADRVIIPESRGGEFKALYEANLKTKGNMFTAHATDADSFLDMCVDMYNSAPDSANEAVDAVKNKICKAIDVIVMMTRVETPTKAYIRIQSISEVCTDDKGVFTHMNHLYEWEFDPESPGNGQYRATGNRVSDAFARRLNRAGIKMSEINELNELMKDESIRVPSLHQKQEELYDISK